jgi:hypothetical protein
VRRNGEGGEAMGMLTAEQVREAVMSADRWEKPMGNTGLTNTHLIIRDDGWQAIADELNAALGDGSSAAIERLRQTVRDAFANESISILVEGNAIMRAIDDVEAATVGAGECVPHGEWESISQTQEVRYLYCECGHELGMDRRDSFPFHRTRLCAIPNYCEECGRKIRKAIKR